MKISMKLSKEEAEAFKTFMTVVKPEEINEETFFKQIFFMGCRALDDQLKQMFDEHKAEIDKAKEETPAPTEETK